MLSLIKMNYIERVPVNSTLKRFSMVGADKPQDADIYQQYAKRQLHHQNAFLSSPYKGSLIKSSVGGNAIL
jgi:hypothetical protein